MRDIYAATGEIYEEQCETKYKGICKKGKCLVYTRLYALQRFLRLPRKVSQGQGKAAAACEMTKRKGAISVAKTHQTSPDSSDLTITLEVFYIFRSTALIVNLLLCTKVQRSQQPWVLTQNLLL